MTCVTTELAIKHLEKLNKALREDLESVSQKLVETEVEEAVNSNPVESLAKKLKILADEYESKVDNPGRGAGEFDTGDLRKAEKILRKIADDSNPHYNELDPDNPEALKKIYSEYREKLMSTINAVELVTAAMKSVDKQVKEIEKQVKEKEAASPPESVVVPVKPSLPRSPLGSSAIIRSQEIERQRIAREIHDGPAQAIANVVLRMNILSKIFEKDPTKVPDEIAKMKTIAQGALDEIRGFIFDLRPMTLQDLGLVATLKRVVASIKEMSGFDVRLIVEGDERQLGQLITLAVFRIAQEALNNVKKYSFCTTTWVHLKNLEDKLVLIVEDDGIGFDPDKIEADQKNYLSFGLIGMRERAEDIGGTLDIISAPKKGTKIVLVVPTQNNPAMTHELNENPDKTSTAHKN
ncbi:MAG: sensor histidine kinase [bacterium]